MRKSRKPKREKFNLRESITLNDVADHIDHICQLAGNSRHAAVSGDTDGQGGCEGAPADVDTVADYGKLADVLSQRGYSADDVENIMFRNWLRVFSVGMLDNEEVANQ